jgi:tRNA pseudouridine55 synthase
MNGILNVLKPPGMTSFDVIGFLRKVSGIKKIGHAGTLDPGAVGVLPVCIGNATKAVEFMMEKDKVYRSELKLGITTDTQDAYGDITGRHDVKVTAEEIKAVIKSFEGRYDQMPPMHSAIKIGGKRLYELARNGISVERKSREIEIYSVDIIYIKEDKVLFDVSCSKGTYIRTLCADIGNRIGCGGHMSFLLRLKAGNFDISSAVTLEEISDWANKGSLEEKLINVDTIFDDFNKVVLDEFDEKKLMNGAFIHYDKGIFKEFDTVRLYNEGNSFIALGEFILSRGNLVLKSKKVF